MKKLFTPIILSIILFSCRPEPIEPNTQTYVITDVNINGENYKKLEGIINENLSLDLNENGYFQVVFLLTKIQGYQSMKEVPFTPDTEVTTFLSIKQGGEMFIQGESTNPIVFTPLTDNPTYGDWGGIIVNGYGHYKHRIQC